MPVPPRDEAKKLLSERHERGSSRMDDRSRPKTAGPDFTEATDPFALFAAWMAEAEATEPVDPNAMALATVDADGLPNVRTVLLKGADGPTASCSTPTAKAPRARSWPPTQGRARCSTGRACGARSACADRSSRPARPRPTPISPRVRARAASAPGPRTSRGRLPAARRSKRPWPALTAEASAGEVPRPPYWRAIGRAARDRVLAEAARSACTTGSCSAAPRRNSPGSRHGSTRS